MKTVALVLFISTYALLLAFPRIRAWIASGSALLFVILGILSPAAAIAAIDWNVLLMLAGSMGIVSLFIASHMPELLADGIIDRMPDVRWAVVSLSLFAGIISAFIDNVATVLMVAPIVLTVAKKCKISPVPGIIAVAVSSNLQGAATLVGDTTSILLGGWANLDFLDFFVYRGRPGMFWVVQAGAAASVFILLWLFRRDKELIAMDEKTKVTDLFPTFLLLGMVGLLILASFIPEKPHITNGLICITLLAIGLAREYFRDGHLKAIKATLHDVDHFTLILLAGMFVVIGGITEVGVIDDISALFVRVGGGNLFIMFSLVLWGSVLFSAFIDNIPYVATMLPVMTAIASRIGVDPVILYFGLLCGATLGGNLTPIGASANIAALGILRKDGYEVSTREFMRIGVPFTLAAVTTGYLMIWFIWRP